MASKAVIGPMQYSFWAGIIKFTGTEELKQSLYFVDVETTVVKTHDVQGSA